jgi:hypothetical protein
MTASVYCYHKKKVTALCLFVPGAMYPIVPFKFIVPVDLESPITFRPNLLTAALTRCLGNPERDLLACWSQAKGTGV